MYRLAGPSPNRLLFIFLFFLSSYDRKNNQPQKSYNTYPTKDISNMRIERFYPFGWNIGIHDVVEDSNWKLEDLRGEGFSEEVLNAIECLTHRKDESYTDFIKRLKPNPIARTVKIADLEDNMDIRRVSHITDRHLDKIRQYHEDWFYLPENEDGT